MSRRMASRVLGTCLAAVAGAVLLSGSDQPVTARPYPSWQELARPPLAPRTHALGLQVGHQVLLLGGRRRGMRLHDAAAYDLRTGIWHGFGIPVTVTDRDQAVAAAGVVVLRRVRAGRPSSWWRYDPRDDTWSRIRDLPGDLSPPSAFGSEVYALSGRRVVVYSIQLDRWTPLPLDRLRPTLQGRAVSASRNGTVVTGYAAHGRRPLTDRWDGLRWRRLKRAISGPATPHGATTRISVGGRSVVFRGDRAWIHTP
jgi:hypothetical protein